MKKTAVPSKAVVTREEKVRSLLAKVMPSPTVLNSYSDDEKIKMIEERFTEILEILGLDLSDDSMNRTPHRIAKMYVKELFSGLDAANFPKMTVIENKMRYDQMIVVQDIDVISCCEHHFQTIQGAATVAYIPDKKVIGLSKINRVVEYFARRPQVQERLTKQIADCLQLVLETEHVAVHINAKHFCVIARGIQDANSSTITSDLRGDFKHRTDTRKEFLLHCRNHI
ncbi:MAG: GTP cyclohydrolase I FolE [Bdellovibrionaceae bacterium]|nr:GTP cyclohydrolase I FolE [Pseudobdellovibrionaceae bacterium]MBX3033167.1 GTP cyclohydrolase I FolE [Pseudobdellovibrionaceae bacterium]